MSNTEIVRASFDAYLAQDRDTAERLIAQDLVFTSPLDDHIDKTAYLERCWCAVNNSSRSKSSSGARSSRVDGPNSSLTLIPSKSNSLLHPWAGGPRDHYSPSSRVPVRRWLAVIAHDHQRR